MGKYFGTDGFRGEVNRVLRAEHAYRIGRFLGWYLKTNGNEDGVSHRPRVVIGKDTRRSSYLLESALEAGLIASGADAYILHVIPTPGVSYVTRTEEFDCGVMISASHNPFSDNGIKLVNRLGEKIDDEMIRLLEAYLDGDLEALELSGNDLPLATGSGIGRVVDYAVGRNRYVGYLISLATRSFQSLRVGLDCANGSAWMIAGAVFEALGAKVFRMNTDPDGTNINRDCGSTHPDAFRKFVVERRLDVGFLFDGDADRCLAVDEKGDLVTGDHILYIFAVAAHLSGTLPGNTIVATVMSNLGLHRALESHGIRVVESDVGDRYVYETMLEGGYRIGGEQSGHIILRKYATTGDGILTAIMLTERMLAARAPLSELAAPVKILPQMTRNIPIRERETALSDPVVTEALSALRRELGGAGRVILRKSGTEPVIRIMAEAESEALCRFAAERMERVIREQGYAE